MDAATSQLNYGSASEYFGVMAFILHGLGYFEYGKRVLQSKIRPNVATWMMWLAGSAVEFLTYDAIEKSHWSTSALPLACLLGIAAVCVAIVIAQYKNNESGVIYHRPERSDYFLVSFDVVAAGVWLAGLGAALANAISVSTSIFSFIPIWRTTYNDPKSEDPRPWAIWCCAYALMLGAVVTGGGKSEFGLYFYPVYYFFLHAVVLTLSLRQRGDS